MWGARLKRITRLWFLPALVFLFSGIEDAYGQISSEPMRLSWNTRIDHLMKEPLGWATVAHHEIESLAFSPDGKRLAVTITHILPPSWNTHLLVVDVQSPKMNVRQFDLSGTCGADLSWSQSGDALLVCGTIVRLTDGAVCVVSNSPDSAVARFYSVGKAFWLDSANVVRWNGDILDLACQHVRNWQLDPTWRIRAVAPSRGWILLSGSNAACEYLVMDRASGRVLSGWARKSACPNMVLAEGAEAVCFNVDGDNITNRTLHCRTVDGGQEISVPKKVRDYVLNLAPASSTRVAADQWKYPRFAFEAPALPRSRVIFDLHAGNVISSWKPRIQHSTSPSIEDWPYRCALSANGKLVAESGDGSLELYRLAP